MFTSFNSWIPQQTSMTSSKTLLNPLALSNPKYIDLISSNFIDPGSALGVQIAVTQSPPHEESALIQIDLQSRKHVIGWKMTSIEVNVRPKSDSGAARQGGYVGSQGCGTIDAITTRMDEFRQSFRRKKSCIHSPFTWLLDVTRNFEAPSKRAR
jgi:hypothetical protein